MLATITAVEVEKAPKGYTIANVSYTRDGKDSKAKVLSFAQPDAYKVVTGLTSFPVDVNVTMEKKGNFWNWKGVEIGGQTSSQSVPQAAKTGGKVIGNNYETAAERAARQVYIVRQSSIANAISYLAAREPKGVTIAPNDVIEYAKIFEQYVFDTQVNLPAEPE